MLDYQIIAGFSEIKTQLRIQTNISKALNELQLWFSFEDDVLYVHDFQDHKKRIALAIYKKNEGEWWIVFRGNAYGRQVVEEAIDRNKVNEIAPSLNELYKSHGFI